MCYPPEDYIFTEFQLMNYINECKEKKEQEKIKGENIKMQNKKEKLIDEKNQLLIEIKDLSTQKDTLLKQKDDLTKQIYKISNDIEIVKNKVEENQKYALLPIIHKENKIYDLHTDLVSDIAKMTTKCEITDKVVIKNLELIHSINDDNTKSTKEMSFYLERNNNKVIIKFEEDYNSYIQNEEYLNLNPCLEQKKEIWGLNKLLTELKKLGDGRKNANEFSLLIDPVKAYVYRGINVFSYINEDFSKQNQNFVDSIIKSGVERDHICIEPKNSNQLYKILVNQLLHENELIVIPSVDILGDDYTDILNFVIDLFYKKANSLIEDVLIEYKDFESSDSISVLNKINDLIELKQNKTDKVVSKVKKTVDTDGTSTKKKAKSSKKTKDSEEKSASKEEEKSNVVELSKNKEVSDVNLDDLE